MTTHMVLPDVQSKPGCTFEHLEWAGKYAAEKKPDVIVCLGDFADMESLSVYDIGKKSFEGRSYLNDVNAALEAMHTFMQPIRTEQERLRRNKEKQWKPRFVLTLGNHEARIDKAVNSDRKLEGLISIDDLQYKEFGWEVVPFLEVINIDGVLYSHYFVSGVLGRPVGSARMLVTKKHQSCTMGHVQNSELDLSQRRGDGTPLIGLFAGIYYQHDEDYLNPQSNKQHRQIWMKYEVNNGFYYAHPVSLEYLRKKYTV